LGAIAPLGAYPVEWGPAVLLLLGAGGELLLLLGMRRIVLGRHLGLVVALLLQERVEIVLVLLVGGGQMRTRALVPLLRWVQAVLLVQLLFCEPGVALPH
jgi:hypothetical protein